MNLGAGEIGIMAVIGLLLFGGLLKSKSTPNSKSTAPKKVETSTTADFQKNNSINSTTPITKNKYNKPN